MRRRVASLSRENSIAALALAAVVVHLALRVGFPAAGGVYGLAWHQLPLLAALAFGGVPLVLGLALRLAGISIVTSIALEEYLAGTLVVLMLSGGQALEAYAVRSASSVLQALARRVPSRIHVPPPSRSHPPTARGCS